jgi:hypothetical protein
LKKEIIFWADLVIFFGAVVVWVLLPDGARPNWTNLLAVIGGLVLAPLNIGISASIYADKRNNA